MSSMVSFNTISSKTTSSTISIANNGYGNSGIDLSKLSKEETMSFFEEVGVFQAALCMLNHMYNAQSKLTNTVFADMNEASKSSIEAQTITGKLDAVIAELQGMDKNATIKLPTDVIKYIENPANDFKIDINLSKNMKMAELQDIKSVISSKSNSLTTEVNNNQLTLQQMMNTINLLTSIRSDIQTLQYRTISAISVGK
ncbi:secretion protein EspA [Salmonella enterica]|nr:secretion protein EspA [Salmonella enterica]